MGEDYKFDVREHYRPGMVVAVILLIIALISLSCVIVAIKQKKTTNATEVIEEKIGVKYTDVLDFRSRHAYQLLLEDKWEELANYYDRNSVYSPDKATISGGRNDIVLVCLYGNLLEDGVVIVYAGTMNESKVTAIEARYNAYYRTSFDMEEPFSIVVHIDDHPVYFTEAGAKTLCVILSHMS